MCCLCESTPVDHGKLRCIVCRYVGTIIHQSGQLHARLIMFQLPGSLKHVGCWQLNRYSSSISFKAASLRTVSFSSSSIHNDGPLRQTRSRGGSRQPQAGDHHHRQPRRRHDTHHVQNGKLSNEGGSSSASGGLIRLNKLMSQLDICSRREADEWTRQGRILVHGETAVLGFKVDPSLVNENDIVILTNSELRDYRKNNKHNPAVAQQQYRKPRHDIDFASIVLHKPVGYVSSHHFRSVISVIRFSFLEWHMPFSVGMHESQAPLQFSHLPPTQLRTCLFLCLMTCSRCQDKLNMTISQRSV